MAAERPDADARHLSGLPAGQAQAGVQDDGLALPDRQGAQRPGPRVQVRAADGLIRGAGRICCRL